MPFLICDGSECTNKIFNAFKSQLEQRPETSATSDEDLKQLPFIDEILYSISLACDVINSGLSGRNAPNELPEKFACIPMYGDGSGSCLLVAEESLHFKRVGIALLDIRSVFECLAHICASPLGRYSPSIELCVALEKLAIATRIAAKRDPNFHHLSIGMLAEAQDTIYGDSGDVSQLGITLDKLIKDSFLAGTQVSMIIRGVVFFQIFHEYGHYIYKYNSELRKKLEDNLSNYIRTINPDSDHQKYHDGENLRVAKVIYKEADINLILTSETTANEYNRLNVGKITARLDKEELLCDNFAVQNSAKILVDSSGLGSADWLLVRYVVEITLVSSWSMLASKPVFQLACETWNKDAKGQLAEEERLYSIDRLEQLLTERRNLILAQSFRLRYTLQQFDTILAVLIHSTLQANADINSTIDLVAPSYALARVMHEFSARHTNLIDRAIYTVEGLGRCSSRGRAIQLLLTPSNAAIPDTIGDVFSFYVLGKAFHF